MVKRSRLDNCSICIYFKGSNFKCYNTDSPFYGKQIKTKIYTAAICKYYEREVWITFYTPNKETPKGRKLMLI